RCRSAGPRHKNDCRLDTRSHWRGRGRSGRCFPCLWLCAFGWTYARTCAAVAGFAVVCARSQLACLEIAPSPKESQFFGGCPMQIILAIPSNQELSAYGGTEQALLRDVSGVPLVIRTVATGLRAGADHVLIVHSDPLPREIQDALRSNPFLRASRDIEFVRIPLFDPASRQSWENLAASLDEKL